MSLSPLDEDRLFGKLLLRLELVAPAELDGTLAELERRLAAGLSVRLGRLLADRGLLRAEQLLRALERSGRAILLCPKCGMSFEEAAYPPAAAGACPACGTGLAVPGLADFPQATAGMVETLALTNPRGPSGHDGAKATLPSALTDSSGVTLQQARPETVLHSHLPGSPSPVRAGRPAVPDGGVPFGRYRLLATLGAGGMGIVWKAWDTELGRFVALKQIRGEAVGGEDVLARFQREAHLAAKLRHPNIVQVHDVGVIDGRHYLTMDCVEGRPLSDCWTRRAKREDSTRGREWTGCAPGSACSPTWRKRSATPTRAGSFTGT